MNNLYIRPITLDDTDDIVRWRNSESVKINLFSQIHLTPEQHIAYFKKNVETGKCYQFIIVADGESIGTVFLKNVDVKTKTAEFGIFIGELHARGKGYASRATRLILDYGFSNLFLNEITLSVFSDNIPAIKAYQKAGFLEKELHKDYVKRDSGSSDVLIMVITRDKWKKTRNV